MLHSSWLKVCHASCYVDIAQHTAWYVGFSMEFHDFLCDLLWILWTGMFLYIGEKRIPCFIFSFLTCSYEAHTTLLLLLSSAQIAVCTATTQWAVLHVRRRFHRQQHLSLLLWTWLLLIFLVTLNIFPQMVAVWLSSRSLLTQVNVIIINS